MLVDGMCSHMISFPEDMLYNNSGCHQLGYFIAHTMDRLDRSVASEVSRHQCFFFVCPTDIQSNPMFVWAC
jgi:hypothetical protein